MAEDKKKELKIDELETVAGGAIERSSPFLETRFVFTQEEVEILKNNGIIGEEAKHIYKRSELNEKGIPGDTAIAIRETLNAWGITVNQTCY